MAFRSLLPWRRFALDTAWSPADVEREVRSFLESPAAPTGDAAAMPSRRGTVHDWDGSAWAGGFRLRRYASRRSRSTALVVTGRVQALPAGSRVGVTLRLPVAAALGLLVGVPLLALLSVAVSVAALVRHEGIVLVVWLMPFAVSSGIMRLFSSEAMRAEEFLRAFFPRSSPPSAGPFR